MKLHKRDVHDNGNAADINEEETINNELNDDQENDQDMVKLVADYEDDLLEKELERLAKIDDTVNLEASKCQECNNVSTWCCGPK